MPLSKDGSVSVPRKSWGSFDRVKYMLLTKDTVRMNRVLNYFRVFSVETFKNIPQFSYCNMYGKYFEDRLIFLMDML